MPQHEGGTPMFFGKRRATADRIEGVTMKRTVIYTPSIWGAAALIVVSGEVAERVVFE